MVQLSAFEMRVLSVSARKTVTVLEWDSNSLCAYASVPSLELFNWIGCGMEQSDLAQGVHAHDRELGLDGL